MHSSLDQLWWSEKKIVEKGKGAGGNITILEKEKRNRKGIFSNGCTLV